MKQLLALALVLLLPISVFAAEEEEPKSEEPTNGQLSADIASLRSAVDRLQTSVTSLQTSVTTLQTSVTSLQGHVTKLVDKRGVAVVEIVSTTARSHDLLHSQFVLQGSTIEGFHDNESFGFSITDSNKRKLPSGTYLFELQQPPPIYHDCNIRRLRACNPLKIVMHYLPSPTNRVQFLPRYPKGAAVFKVDGTVSFGAHFHLPAATLTATGQSAAGHKGLLTITQLD